MRLPIIVVSALTGLGCNWLSLGANAVSYDTLAAGDAGNIVARGSSAYVTLAESGYAVVDGVSGRRLAAFEPPPGLGSVDDIAIDGDRLFLLDARAPGALAVINLNGAEPSALLAVDSTVPVGPFSGVSAAGGHVVVSGGTSQMKFWRIDEPAQLSLVGELDLGRGQPDVLLGPSGIAYVSTHYWGPYFGVDVARPTASRDAFEMTSQVRLSRAGFTAGGAKPANFPIEAALLDEGTLIVAHAAGVAVIEVRDPAAIRVLEVIDVGGPAVNVDSRDGVAFVAVAGSNPFVAIITFVGRRPQRIERRALPSGTNPVGITSVGRTVLVAARDRGVLAVTH